MKSKLLFLLLATVSLPGCTSNTTLGETNGKIDCYSIVVKEGESIVFSQTYYSDVSLVYEYISSNGLKIYTPNRFQYFDRNESTYKDSTIRTFQDKYAKDYTEYTYSRFVGFLTLENNYYLDLEKRTIDSEIKWYEFKYETNPTTIPDGEPNNKEAYACAKTNYYHELNSNYDNQFVSLRLDTSESSLETHTYTVLGQNGIITYKAKWF